MSSTPVASIGTSLDDGDTTKAISGSDSAATPSNPLVSQPFAANAAVTHDPSIPSVSAAAVLGESASMPADSIPCRGHDFSQSRDIDSIVASMLTTGFQATHVGQAVERIRALRSWRLSDVPWSEGDDEALRPERLRSRIRARVFFAYTSNQISCGQREVIKFLVENKMVDVIVTTAGGIEEDIIKCFQPTYMGDFKLSGRELRKKGINRIGNLLVPNRNYCEFEDWFSPILSKLHDEQDEKDREWARQVAAGGPSCSELPPKFAWTPSAIIRRLGLEINHPDSVLYWAAVNDIPIFCPALTDGSLGDMLYFHSYKRPGFVLDIAADIRRLNDMAVQSHCTGQIILGGGLVKHHTCNANLMRNGADYSVYINTASEFDGSDSGASPDEAVSWGKIRLTAQPVKVNAEATIVFPLIVASTFAKDVGKWRDSVKDAVLWAGDLNSNDE